VDGSRGAGVAVEQPITELYETAIPSVVSVYVTREGHAMRGRGGGAGSGFVYDESGHLITNQHVVGDTDYVEVRFADGQWRTGAVVGRDRYTDLAIIHISDLPADATPLPVAETNPDPGQRVAAIGNPMGLDGSITVGYVSATNRSMSTGSGFTIPETIQTDAAVNPGNSGGPLLTLDGTVVGVNRAKGGDNIGFAISPMLLDRVVPALLEDGKFRPAYLSVRMLDVSPSVAAANQLDASAGVLVVAVGDEYAGHRLRGCSRSASYRGRQIPVGGDVIVGVDEESVRSAEELSSYLLTEVSPGEEIELTIRRNGEVFTEIVRLGERPAPDADDRTGADHRPRRQSRDPTAAGTQR
jgi:S1-C subfamily serine protease